MKNLIFAFVAVYYVFFSINKQVQQVHQVQLKLMSWALVLAKQVLQSFCLSVIIFKLHAENTYHFPEQDSDENQRIQAIFQG